MREFILVVVSLVASALIQMPGYSPAGPVRPTLEVPTIPTIDRDREKLLKEYQATTEKQGEEDVRDRLTPTPWIPWSPVPTPTRTWE